MKKTVPMFTEKKGEEDGLNAKETHSVHVHFHLSVSSVRSLKGTFFYI